MGAFENLKGLVFGRLTVQVRTRYRDRVAWWCKCECGKSKMATSQLLKRGNVRSCGCLQRDLASARQTTHGMSNSREYKSWSLAKKRCYNRGCRQYRYYGGRGIRMCRRWRVSFQEFLNDMGSRPIGSSLDRKNNNGHYTPLNCRWATQLQQSNNTRGNRIIAWRGERKSIAQWARAIGLKYNTLWWRVKYGWSTRRALTTV